MRSHLVWNYSVVNEKLFLCIHNMRTAMKRFISQTYYVTWIFLLALAMLPPKAQAQQVIELAKQQPGDPAQADNFGQSVFVDGNREIVGAPGKDGAAGAAYLFEPFTGMPMQVQKLQAVPPTMNERFGWSVSMSGTWAIVGAPGQLDGTVPGAAYLFERDGNGVWNFALKLQNQSADDLFGFSVSISGNRAIVGAPAEATGGNRAGAAYIFEYVNGSWNSTPVATLKADPVRGGAEFGFSVSISGDGAIVGAYKETDAGGTFIGAAYIFDALNWSQKPQRLAGTVPGNFFGLSVSISGDLAIVGEWAGDATGNVGAAYIVERTGNVWTAVHTLQPAMSQTDDGFGVSVSIAPGGGLAVVGASADDTGGANTGAAYLFESAGGAWNLPPKKVQASDGELGDRFGISVSISGNWAAVGAYRKATDAGAAYLFKCIIAECDTDNLALNTGLDHTTGTPYAAGNLDGFWRIVDDPISGTIEPRPAAVVASISDWTAAPAASQWTAPYPTAANNVNGLYVYEFCFCLLEEDATLNVDLSLLADDEASVYLADAPYPAGTRTFLGKTVDAFTPATSNSPFRQATAIVAAVANLAAQRHCLQVDVNNVFQVASGLNVVGTVSGASVFFEENACCNDTGSIQGTLFNDLNGNSLYDQGEPGLTGWTVSLKDASGTEIATTTSDALGNYYFLDLKPGIYEVEEEAMIDWKQSTPAAPGTYTVGVGVGQVVSDLDFGNQQIVTDVERLSEAIPATFALETNYPNPFNPTTTIHYALPRASLVRLEVFDVLGRKVATLVDATQAAGQYKATFEASHLTSGVYLYRLTAGAFIETRRMILAK